MASVLEQFANCTIYVKVTKGYAYNPETLNDELVSEELQIRAILRDNQAQRINTQAGVDLAQINMQGKCISPQSLPSNLGLPQTVTVKFDNGTRGRMELTAGIPSPYYDQVGLLGQPIFGRFTYTGVE